MENDSSDGGKVFPNGEAENGKVVRALQRIYGEVQELLERNRMLIQEIGEIHEVHEAGGLIREFNSNTTHIMEIYSDISSSFSLPLVKASPTDPDTAKEGYEGLHPPQ
ncbi:hypothetical protein ACQ4PT_006651 [Festuca glaucescens]